MGDVASLSVGLASKVEPAMRAAYLCALALCVGVMVGQQAESSDIPAAVLGFQEADVEASVHPFEDVEEGLFQEDANPVVAQAFMGCGFQGEARSLGTPMVVAGHNNVGSLKVPTGQCVSLFNKPGYNDGHEGEMLAIRGPMNVPCLDSIKLREGTLSWKDATQSYKMGPCTAKPTNEMATAAIKDAAKRVPDLFSLSNAAKKAAEGQFGSIVRSFTKSDKEDGIAYPYDIHQVVMHDAEFMGEVVKTSEEDPGTTAAVAAEAAKQETTQETPYAEHAIVKEDDKIEHDPEPKAAGSGGSNKAAGSGGFKWKHEALGKQAWTKFHIPFPKAVSPKPFKDTGNSPTDDMDDLLRDAKKNSAGCDPLLGCVEPPKPCTDKDAFDVCSDYVTNGDCQFDFVQRDCQKSCGLCPPPQGSISSDAHLGPMGHYYLGGGRRRIGAGFGRRRHTPAPKKKEKNTITSPKSPEKETEKVPASILHPDGKKEVEKKDPDAKHGVDCDKCISDFAAADGCEVWKKGGDATNLVPTGCAVCAQEAAKYCGISGTVVSKDEAEKEIPKPVEHPKEAAALVKKAAEEDTKEVEKNLPKTVADSVKKVLKEAGAVPATGSGRPATLKEEVKQTEQQAATTAAKDDGKAAVAGTAAGSAAGTAAKAEVVAEKAESTVVEKKAAAPAPPAGKTKAASTPADVKTAETKAGAAETAAAKDDSTAVKEQATADKAAATAEKADAAATKDETKAEKTETPVSELPKTEAEVVDTKAEDWAEEQLKKNEAQEKTMA